MTFLSFRGRGKIFIYTTVFAFACSFYGIIYAETPVVTSFNAPSSLESGQIANFGWTIQGGGHSFVVFCTQGIKLVNASSGQVFPCDRRTSISKSASDGISLYVANVSGSGRIVTAKIIPKDANGGVDYDAGAKEANFYVNPSREPISGFFASATTTISGLATTLSWTSRYLDGVNLRIECNESITATTSLSGKQIVPCGQNISSADLPGSGSISVFFTNQSSADLPLTVTLLPAMSPGVYDGTHSTRLLLTVASDAQKPVTTLFSSTRTKIFSGDSVQFSWTIVNGLGANIKFSCTPYVTLQTYSSATTTQIACGDYAWQNPLSPTGTTSISFLNSNTSDEFVTATIFPFLKNKSYSGIDTSTIRISVAPPVSGAPSLSQQAVATSTNKTVPNGIQTASNPKPETFKRWLGVGSKGADVSILQKYLARDRSLYPEGYITGTFGAITKRAVGRFQVRYGIMKKVTDPGYGTLDTKTRAKLNSLQ